MHCSYAVFQDDNNLYLMMEFLSGGELFSHLRKNATLTDDIARYATPLLYDLYEPDSMLLKLPVLWMCYMDYTLYIEISNQKIYC